MFTVFLVHKKKFSEDKNPGVVGGSFCVSLGYTKKLEYFLFPKDFVIRNFRNVESFTAPSYRELNDTTLCTGKNLNFK